MYSQWNYCPNSGATGSWKHGLCRHQDTQRASVQLSAIAARRDLSLLLCWTSRKTMKNIQQQASQNLLLAIEEIKAGKQNT